MCSICAQVCHEGHDISYSRYSRFFCDCGANPRRGVVCKSLKPRPPQPRSRRASVSSKTAAPIENQYTVELPPAVLDSLKTALKEKNLAQNLYKLYETVLSYYKQRKASHMEHDLDTDDLFSTQKKIESKNSFEYKRHVKGGSFDVRFKFNDRDSNTLRTALANNYIARSGLSINSQGKIAIAEGDCVTIADPSRLLEEGTSVLDKHHCKVYSRTVMGFEVVGVSFNKQCECYLAVAGIKQCRVLTFNNNYQVVNQLELNLSLDSLDSSNFIIQAQWVPGSQVHLGKPLGICLLINLAVITQQFVKIYDLSKDNICPVQALNILDDKIQSTTFIYSLNPDSDEVHIAVLTLKGNLYTKKLFDTSEEQGPVVLTDPIKGMVV